MKDKKYLDRLILAADQHIKERDYWLDYLSGDLVKSGFLYDNLENKPTAVFDTIKFNFSGELFSRLMKLSNNSDYTLNAVLAVGLTLLLYKYTGNTDIVIGAPIYKQEIAGDFINTVLTLRNHLQDHMTFKELLLQVGRNIYHSVENQDYPIEILLKQLNITAPDRGFPLFDTILLLENIHDKNYTRHIRVNTCFSFLRKSDCIEGLLEYNPSLYEKTTIQRIIGCLRHLFQETLNNLELPVCRLDIVPRDQKIHLLLDFNNKTADFLKARPPGEDKTICQLLESQAGRAPHRIALACEESQLTYRVLHEKSSRLARLLKEKGITTDSLVGILCERSIEMAIGILSVWKAGGAYIPIDSNYPFERINTFLNDSGAEVLLTKPGSIDHINRFYEEIAAHTKVRHIIHLDKLNNISEHNQLFKTHRLSLLLGRGIEPEADKNLVLQYEKQTLTYQQYMEKVEQIHGFVLDRKIDIGSCAAVMFTNPLYRIIALLYLNSQDIPFIVLDPGSGKSNCKRIIHETGIAVVFSESCFLDELDQLLWESTVFNNYIILDDYDAGIAEKESHFKDIWDYVAGESSEAINDYGWSSSYTNEPFTIEEMEEYIQNFKTKLAPYLASHSRVLDIGCGHGLVLFAIAPYVGYYLATDLSPVIIEKNKRRLQKLGLHNVELKAAPASAINKLQEKNFDLIICSSVVHYFPNTLYLEEMIKNAIALLKEEGIIYLDDLMALGKKEELIRSTTQYKKSNPEAQVKTDWDGDLFVGIDFFHDLQLKYPEILQWESSPKLGRIENELTRSRYDVLLKINKTVKNRNKLPDLFKKHRVTRRDLETHSKVPIGSSPKNLHAQTAAIIGEVSDISAIASYSPGKFQRTRGNDSAGLSYVIYTSGSTGKPKGVMVNHSGMMNHLQAKVHDLQLTGNSIIVQNASHTFDISVWQFFAALVSGGKTIIYPDPLILDLERFVSRLLEDRVTILEVVPSYLSVMLDYLEERQGNTLFLALPLRYLLVTGEEIKPNLVKKWFEKYPGIKMVNAYGPTEASDDITHHIMDKAPAQASIPIGKPLQNLDIYILDKNMHLCPLGVKGEICVSGIGVGRGYLNDPPLTAEKFIELENDFGERKISRKNTQKDTKKFSPHSPHSPIYRTGDIGRWLVDGTIEFFGRKDYQVKIRGYRIELGEIESKLLDHKDIKEAVVLDKEDTEGNKYLCAYLVTTAPGEPGLQEVKAFLSEGLPAYMVPMHFIRLDRLPLTSNGKIDRRALPAPEPGSDATLPYITAKMLEKVVVKPEKSIKGKEKKTSHTADSPPVLSTAERNRILYTFNRTRQEYPRDKMIHQLFQDQVEKTPDHVALVGSCETHKKNYNISYMSHLSHISYKELNEKSNQLAYLLRQQGVKPGIIVGVMVKRSVEMLIGIFALLKAGGSYLPIGPEYPVERARYMAADCRVQLLLVNNKKTLPGYTCTLIELDDRDNYQGDASNLAVIGSPRDTAYINYTSGSTGKSKGVMIENRSVVNIIKGITDIIAYTGEERVLSLTTVSFDVFVTETILPLTRGSKVVIGNADQQLDAIKTAAVLVRENITLLQSTPSIMRSFITVEEMVKSLKPLSYLLITAEALPLVLLEKIRKITTARIYNLYGPTETTVWATLKEVSAGLSLNIGKPLANTRVYILGLHRGIQPVGIAGELCIGGDGVARGYLNNPELTFEKFDHDLWDYRDYHDEKQNWTGKHHNKKFLPGGPGGAVFSKSAPPGRRRLYRTGDLAMWLPDGNIEFIGRMDHQVQIRGLRIEPGEVESYLLTYEPIKEAVVIPGVDKNGDTYLCAFVVSPLGLREVELRNFLAPQLPQYMIPSLFVQLEKMPLTPNGKLNRQVLQALDVEIDTGARYKAPRDQTEKQLVEIWSDLLGIDKQRIGITDNFFELGGHSLRATILISRIHREFNVKIPLAEVFQAPLIKGLAQYIANARQKQYTSIKASEKKEYYVLSSAQKRLYILQQMEPGGIVYNIPDIVSLQEVPVIEKLEETLRKLLQRHESLRTSFHMIADEPMQRIHDKVEFEIEYYNSGRQGNRETGNILENSGRQGNREIGNKRTPLSLSPSLPVHFKAFIRPFDLSQAPLLRVALLPASSILMLDMHHIISDAISHEILQREFIAMFRDVELPPLRLQYKDFAQWQQGREQKKRIKHQESYWLKEFAGEIPVLDLPIDYQRPLLQDFTGHMLSFEISPGLSAALKVLASSRGVTLYMLLLSAFYVLLFKLSGQEDIIVGTPTAARSHADLQEIIGMFVNTLALRNFPNRQKTFKTFLQEVKDRTLAAFENQEYPFEELVEKVEVPRDVSRSPLFDVMFAFHTMGNTPASPLFDNHNSQAQQLRQDNARVLWEQLRVSKFDLTITAVEQSKELLFTAEYSKKLFTKETLHRFINCFRKVLSEISRDIHQPLGQIQIISEEEKHQVLYDFNSPEPAYPTGNTLQQSFAEQVRRTPDHTALVGAHQIHEKNQKDYNMSYQSHISYKEINEKANQLAHLLIEKGVRPDTIVGLMPERSIEMIIGILAVLKAGGAYLPIDPEYPQDRIDYMLKDSGAKILLTRQEIASLSSPEAFDIGPKGASSHLHQSPAPVSSLAYLIYTSGTTGRPKGVMIQHQNACNTVYWFNRTYQLEPGLHVLQLTDIVFDVSVEEIFSTLLSGAVLFIPRKDTIMNREQFISYIKKHFINIAQFVPIALKELIATGDDEKIPCLDIIICGGDRLSDTLKTAVISKGYTLYNHYGPTEITVDALACKCGEANVVIGKPISNVQAYVVDKNMNLQPIGVPGELCISGAGVARGYLNNPELTAEKFFSIFYKSYTSYMTYISKKIYRTGDLARWLPDGNIEFLGRIDAQIKSRGYRIEPGEIENHLLAHKEIKEAIVVARDGKDEDKYLCAYVVVPNAGAFTKETSLSSSLRKYLMKTLPAHMIPAYFVRIDKIPLTASGKVDGKCLPLPGKVADSEYVAPRHETEKKLAAIWTEILSRGPLQAAPPGINDNFFELGGHSLKATTLVSRIRKEFQVAVPLVEVFKNPTIRSLATYIQRAALESLAGNDERLLLLKPGINNDKHLFFIHDGSGQVEGYIELCEGLPPLFNYWGICSNLLECLAPRQCTIEELARECIEKIKKIQPHDPYHIAGWSLGGTIAFEIALQLEQAGESVSFLGLLDSPGPPADKTKKTRDFNVESELAWLWEYLPGNEIKEKVKEARDLNETWTMIVNYFEENHLKIEIVIQLVNKDLAGIIPHYHQLGLRELISHFNTNRSLTRARGHYIPPGKVKTTLHFFAAGESPGLFKESWHDYCKEPIKSYELPGDHFSIFKPPHVTQSAKIIEDALWK